MEMVYYSTKTDGPGDSFFQTLASTVPSAQTAFCSTIEDLKTALLATRERQTLAVFDIQKEEDLLDIYFISHLFRRFSTIMILPDNTEHTIALGRVMKPDFLFFKDTNRDELFSLVQLLLRKHGAVVSINTRRTLMVPHAGNSASGMEQKVSNF